MKDNISLRVSFYYSYTIANGEKYISCTEQIDFQRMAYVVGDERVTKIIQERFREVAASISSEELNTKRSDFANSIITEDVSAATLKFGIMVEKVYVIDITFPKNIQEIFASELAARVRAKTDLENAHTSVAVARTYKNAAALMQGDENIRFIQLLETLQRIAAKGNHTFVIGEHLYGKK